MRRQRLCNVRGGGGNQRLLLSVPRPQHPLPAKKDLDQLGFEVAKCACGPPHVQASLIAMPSYFKYIPSECSGIELRLFLALSADRLGLKKFIEVTNSNSAKLYRFRPRKRGIIEGESDADINI